jgi:hypothetical protein
MKKLIRIQAGQSKIIEGKTFQKELELQEIVKSHPELIPLDELGEDIKPMLIIGREFSVGDAGLVDLLGIDVTGLLTVIEFKLEKNTTIREAVAQTLEYAANLWGMSYQELENKCLAYFRSDRCSIPDLKTAKSLEQALAWHHKRTTPDGDVPFNGEDFKNRVIENLNKGEFRLILFCDEVDSRTKKAVEYIHTLARFDFYCASAEFFDDSGIQYIRPIMVTKERDDKSTEKRHAGKTSYNEFMIAVSENNRDFVPIYQKFAEAFEEISGRISWGTKGFAAYFPTSGGQLRLFEGYPDDIWIITKVGLEKYSDQVPPEAKLELEESLKSMPHFKKVLAAQGRLNRIRLSEISPADLDNLFGVYLNWHKKWFLDGKEMSSGQ